MILEWTEPAVNALRAIHDYIAHDQPFYAARFIERIVVTAERLRDFPDIGRKVPEADKNDVRELIFQGYRIIYRHEPDRIRVLTVVHGSRDLARKMIKPWEIG
jgi:plasmid stabilization system protein ParE